MSTTKDTEIFGNPPTVGGIVHFLQNRAFAVEHQRAYKSMKEKDVRKFVKRHGDFFPFFYSTFQSLPEELREVFRQAKIRKCWEVFFELLPKTGEFAERCKLVVTVPLVEKQGSGKNLYSCDFLHAVILVDDTMIFDPILMKYEGKPEFKIAAYLGFALQKDYVKDIFARPMCYKYSDIIKFLVHNYRKIDPAGYSDIYMRYDYKKVREGFTQ